MEVWGILSSQPSSVCCFLQIRQRWQANHTVLCEVFQPVDRLVCLEMQITQAEERLDIVGKQRLENDFVRAVEDFCHELFPETQSVMFPDEVMPLAEACIFYESKCVDEWLHLAKYLIKDYLELRIYVMKIPEERLKPEHKDWFGRLGDSCGQSFNCSDCDA